MHVNFLTSVNSSEEILQFMEKADNIVRYSSLILRLVDDLGTSPVHIHSFVHIGYLDYITLIKYKSSIEHFILYIIIIMYLKHEKKMHFCFV